MDGDDAVDSVAPSAAAAAAAAAATASDGFAISRRLQSATKQQVQEAKSVDVVDVLSRFDVDNK